MTALALGQGGDLPADPGAPEGHARWVVCFALVLALHGVVLAALMAQRSMSQDAGEALPAVMVDMAPPPTAPTVSPVDTPPSEAIAESTAPDPRLDAPPDVPDPEIPPPEPVVAAEVPPLPDVPEPPPIEAALPPSPVVQPKAEVALPQPRRAPRPPVREVRRPVPRKERAEPKPARPVRAARGERRIERRPPSESGARTTASVPNVSNGASSAASRASWQSALVSRLRRSLRPQGSQTGQASVRFAMSRSGQVLSTSLVRSAGSPALDQEALAVFHRAQPLPPAPADVPGTSFTFTIPIRFTSR